MNGNTVTNAGDAGITMHASGTVNSNNVYMAGQHGINLSTVDDVTVMGNYVANCSQSDTLVYHGIRGYASVDCSIIGNRVYDDAGSPTQGYGIKLQNGDDYCTVTGNILRGNGTGAFASTGSHHIVKNNLGYITEYSGVASVADGDSIGHGLADTPTAYFATATGASHIVAITGVSADSMGISLKTDAGASVSTPENVSWWAEIR